MEQSRITHGSSYIENINGVDFMCLNESSHYETGLASGTLLVKSKNSLIKFFQSWVLRQHVKDSLKYRIKHFFAKIKQERFVFYSAISFILPSLTDFNNVIVIHDLASLKFPALNNLKAKIIERLCLAAACRQAKKIIVPSQSVRKELVNLMPELTTKTIVVAEG